MTEFQKTNELDSLPERLLSWYDSHARILPWRSNPVPYHIWVSEIMLQQTRVEAVKPYFDRFLTTLPDLASLAEASEETILKLWEGLGYYNRVRNMQKAARIVMEQYGGMLPADPLELQKLPGIGEYTAGAVASIAFGEAIPCVDGNVLRVFSRLLSSDADITKNDVKRKYIDLIQDMIPKDRPGDFNQALMELGATVCIPNGNPLCQSCPLDQNCLGYEKGTMSSLPVKTEKKPRRVERITVLVLMAGGRVALRRRPATGLLSGLWEFPSLEGWISEPEVREIFSAWQCPVERERIKSIPMANHIFTHVEWHMASYLVQIPEELQNTPELLDQGITWFDAQQVKQDLALPKAYKHHVEAYFQALVMMTKSMGG